MRESGTYRLEELVSDLDGTYAYQVPADDQAVAIGGSWDMATADVDHVVDWAVDDHEDGDDLEVSMSVDLYARIMRLAAIGREYSGCSGCARVTRT